MAFAKRERNRLFQARGANTWNLLHNDDPLDREVAIANGFVSLGLSSLSKVHAEKVEGLEKPSYKKIS